MKTITCIDCDEQFSGETPEAIQQQMMPHYKEKHADVMAAGTEEKMKAWFAEFEKRWNEAEEK